MEIMETDVTIAKLEQVMCNLPGNYYHKKLQWDSGILKKYIQSNHSCCEIIESNNSSLEFLRLSLNIANVYVYGCDVSNNFMKDRPSFFNSIALILKKYNNEFIIHNISLKLIRNLIIKEITTVDEILAVYNYLSMERIIGYVCLNDKKPSIGNYHS